MIECFLIKNDCYKKYKTIFLDPVGIVVHATDPTEDGTLSRFVQPAAGQTGYINGKLATEVELFHALGKNKYGNHWNRSGVEKAVHYMVGLDAAGEMAVARTLHDTMPCWGAGSGPKGSFNGCYKGEAKDPLYIQIEMIEDKNASLEHCQALYKKTVWLCAYLVKTFPKIGKNIVSHKEAHALGYASDHGDPEGYWKRAKSGYTMNGFRDDVVAQLQEPLYKDVPSDAWYSEYVAKATALGIMYGRGDGLFCPTDTPTRAELAAVACRLYDLM